MLGGIGTDSVRAWNYVRSQCAIRCTCYLMAEAEKKHMARDRNVAIANFDLYVQTWSVRACGKQAYPKTELQSGDRLSTLTI